MIGRLLVLGASGGPGRYLLPALARLYEAGRLPELPTVVGVARHDWDTATFRCQINARLERHAPTLDPAAREALAAVASYHRADIGDAGALAGAVDPAKGPLVAYLALPPAAFAPAIQALATVGLPDRAGWRSRSRSGTALPRRAPSTSSWTGASGRTRSCGLTTSWACRPPGTSSGCGSPTGLLSRSGNAGHIQRVEIVWDETVALEGRAGYYDHAGALRDVVQNHLLQLVCLVAMEPPARLDPHHLHDRKVELLRAVQPPPPGQMAARTVRARYTAGRIDGVDVPAYAEEPGVNPTRGTETFAQVTLRISNPRWAGVPFTLRTGKALAHRRSEVLVCFRAASQPTFPEAAAAPANLLRLGLDPDRLTLRVNLNGAGHPFRLEQAELEHALAPQQLPAYGRLLLAVLQGDPTLSIRGGEAEECWRIAEPILAAWAEGALPLQEYPAGSAGPRILLDHGGDRRR